MDTLAVRNKNPGNLKDPATGTFRSFSDPIEGKAALYNDLTAKMTGSSTTGIHGGSSLIEFAKTYAPASDKNDPIQYAANLANKLGVSPDTQIGTLKSRIDDFVSAVASNEDPSVTYQATSPVQSQSPQQQMAGYDTSVEGIPEAPAPKPSEPGAIPGVIDQFKKGDYLGSASSAIRKFGNFATMGGSETLGKSIGTLGGYVASPNKEQYDLSAPSPLETTLAGAKLVAAGYGVKGLNALKGSLLDFNITKGSALAKPQIQTMLKSVLDKGETLKNLSTQDALTTLGNNLRELPITEIKTTGKLIAEAMAELTPSAVEKAGLIKRLVSMGLKGAGFIMLEKALGGSYSKFKSGLIP